MELPLVAIVGRPNVGKSTLFNRLVGARTAIVTAEAGVTRDRLYGTVEGDTRGFRLVDTGGLTPRAPVPFAREIQHQVDVALEEAAVVLFVVDARAGIGALDQELAGVLRRLGKPLLLVANKVDDSGGEARLALGDLYELGLGAPLAVSAEHARGVDELVGCIEAMLDGTVPAPGGAAETPGRRMSR